MTSHVHATGMFGKLPRALVRIHRVRGLERLSRGYRFDIELTSTVAGAVFEQAVLGERAELSLRVGSAARTVCGLVSRITALEHLSDVVEATRLAVRLVPTSWLLGRRTREWLRACHAH